LVAQFGDSTVKSQKPGHPGRRHVHIYSSCRGDGGITRHTRFWGNHKRYELKWVVLHQTEIEVIAAESEVGFKQKSQEGLDEAPPTPRNLEIYKATNGKEVLDSKFGTIRVLP
jgi:hypothetical protein